MKKKTGISFLALALLLLGVFAAKAQTSTNFSAPTMTVEPNAMVLAHIRVTGFQEIVGAQYSMSWNPVVLRFLGVENLALNLSASENFGTSGAETGTLTFSWYDPSLAGMNLADNSILYSIRFEAIGVPGSSTNIAFTNTPTVKEVVDTTFVPINAGFIDGAVSILGPNSIDEYSETRVQVSECLPNPFRDNASFSVRLKESGRLYWEIFDATGKSISSEESWFGAGEHVVSVKAQLMDTPGAYFCRFSFNNGTVISRRLIKQ